MPACIRVQVWDAAPGKQAEMMALMREAVPLWEKHGAKTKWDYAKNPERLRQFWRDRFIFSVARPTVQFLAITL